MLLDKATTVFEVAAPERLTVQEEDVPEAKLTGPQLSPDKEMVTGVLTVTFPPVAASGRLAPRVEAATGAKTWMERVGLEEEPSVALTLASTPSPMAVLLRPAMIQVCPPVTGTQMIDLPALLPAAPRLTETAEKSDEL